jgi:AraC family transcriptional regulator of adaptative response/methylated-DNA-[protein]-cysteine methyltransferase
MTRATRDNNRTAAPRKKRMSPAPARREDRGQPTPDRAMNPAAARTDAATLEDVRRYLDARGADTVPLAELARRAGMSPYTLQRRFKAHVGVTPKEYQEAQRLKLLKRELRTAPSVTDAIYGAGYGSGSRVYERVDTRLGMTPAQYRARGAGVAISWAAGGSPLGRILIGATDRGICFLQFGDDDAALADSLAREYPAATLTPMPAERRAEFESWMRALSDYLAGEATRIALPLDPHGTAFQLKVWKALQEIPYGEVASYAEVARRIGAPRATRAVASACARNAIALAIPCHRVIRGDGALGGYRWGEARKRTMIDSERAERASGAA